MRKNKKFRKPKESYERGLKHTCARERPKPYLRLKHTYERGLKHTCAKAYLRVDRLLYRL